MNNKINNKYRLVLEDETKKKVIVYDCNKEIKKINIRVIEINKENNK